MGNKKKDKMTDNNEASKPSNSETCVNKLSKFSFIFRIVEFKLKVTNELSSVFNLGIRIWISWIFLKSGLLKLPKDFIDFTAIHSSIKQAYSWDSTLYLFTDVHPVPVLPPKIAAVIGTGLELLCPIFLILGLGARPAAAILLIMTAVIEFTSDPDFLSEVASAHHHIWMLVLAIVTFYGAGKLSLDHIIRKKSLSCPKYREMVGIKD